MLKKYIIFATIILGLAGTVTGESKIALDFTHFYQYDEMTATLKKLAAAYPDLLRLESIGKSFQQRDLWAVTINNPKTGTENQKPAMYIHANIHGNEIQGTEVCLYTIWYLMENYQKNKQITELVDQRVFYILPSVNPDGRAHWFAGPNNYHSSRGGQKPTDDDRDWLMDEDDYDDLDGDGEILQMRKKDPEGKYKLSQDDPRIRLFIRKNEQGQYTYLGTEGIDNDGDGLINEDTPGSYDPNRNWPSMWQPQYIQQGAGDFPLSLPESEAVAKFILSRPNIAGVQGFHNAGGMILRGPGAKDFGNYPGRDVGVYNEIGKKGEKILPHYNYLVIHKDLYSVYGGFINWTFEDLGIYSFTNELFSSKQYIASSNENKSNRMLKRQEERLLFNDLVEFGEMYVDWHPFKHPQYGDIEIGGWKKFARRINPTFMLPELCHRNCAFTLFHARQLPQPEIQKIEITKLNSKLYRVRVGVTNKGLIPTISQISQQHKLQRPDILEIEGSRIHVISAGKLKYKWTNKISRIQHRPQRLLLSEGLWLGQTDYYEWIVSGSETAKITLDCSKGGVVSKKILLN